MHLPFHEPVKPSDTHLAGRTVHAGVRGSYAGAPPHSHTRHSDSGIQAETHNHPSKCYQATSQDRDSSSCPLQLHRRQPWPLPIHHWPCFHCGSAGSTRHRPSSPARPLQPRHAHLCHPSTSASQATHPHSRPASYYQTWQTVVAQGHSQRQTSASHWSGTARSPALCPWMAAAQRHAPGRRGSLQVEGWRRKAAHHQRRVLVLDRPPARSSCADGSSGHGGRCSSRCSSGNSSMRTRRRSRCNALCMSRLI